MEMSKFPPTSRLLKLGHEHQTFMKGLDLTGGGLSLNVRELLTSAKCFQENRSSVFQNFEIFCVMVTGDTENVRKTKLFDFQSAEFVEIWWL